MSFLYPRTVSIFRPHPQLTPSGGAGLGQASQPGSIGTYFGPKAGAPVAPSPAGDDPILADVPCSIQGTAGRATGTGELPADAPGPSRWQIFIARRACPKGTIKIDDILIDDEGARYQVSAPYWNSLGWKVETILLKN